MLDQCSDWRQFITTAVWNHPLFPKGMGLLIGQGSHLNVSCSGAFQIVSDVFATLVFRS